MGAIEVYSAPKGAAGSTFIVAIPQWISCWYGDSIDNNANCTLVVANDSPALAGLAISNVVRLTTDVPAEPVVEYRIRRLDDSIHDPAVTVVGTPLIQDLADIVISSVIGGIRRLDVTGSALTLAQWISTWILPSLAHYGITYISAGTITPTGTYSLNTGYNLTCLGLLEGFLTGTDYRPRLRRNGDSGYFLDIVIPNASATSPVVLVGRNVTALSRSIDGLTESSVIVPQGRVPTNDTYRQTVSEYGMKVTAVGAGTLTVADPDGNQTGPIYFANQESGQWVEKLLVPKNLRDENDGFNGFPSFYGATSNPVEACAVTTQNELWVLGGNGSAGWIDVLDLDTLAYKVRLAIATYRPMTNGGGIVYDVTNGKVFVGVWDGTNSKVLSYVASTRVLGATIAIGAYSVGRGCRASNGRVYFTTATNNGVKRIDPATDTVAATIAGTFNNGDIQPAGSLVVVTSNTTNFMKIDPTTDGLTTLASATDTGVAWNPTNSRAYATSGATIKVFDIAGAMTLSTTISPGLGSLVSVAYCATTGYVYALPIQGGGSAILVLDPATNTYLKSLLGVIGLIASGFLGRFAPEHATEGRLAILDPVYSGTYPKVGRILPFYPANEGLVVRRQIAASTTAGVLTVTGTLSAFAVNDMVQIRDDSAGSWRTELKDPSTYAVYNPRVTPLDRADLSGEHSYARNQWADTSVNQLRVEGWDRKVNNTEFLTPHILWTTPDAGVQATQACTLDSAVVGGQQTAPLAGLPVGYVVQPGDQIVCGGETLYSCTRNVADGAGKIVGGFVLSRNVGWAVGHASGLAATLNRPNPVTLLGLLPNGVSAAVLPNGATSGTASELGLILTIPYVAGRTTAQIQISVLVWRVAFTPSTSIQLVIYNTDGSTLATITPTDATFYVDLALVEYVFTYQATLTGPATVAATVRRTTAGQLAGTYIVRDVRVVLGPDPMAGIAPFKTNYLKGELYHAGMRKVRDLAAPVIDYTVEVLEDDPNAPFLLGVTTTLQDPERSIVAAPKVVAITRYLAADGEGGGLVMPRITLNNKPPELTTTLNAAGSL